MSVKQVITCDECGAERKETNHWHSAIRRTDGWFWMTFDQAEKCGAPTQRCDFCGQNCATQAFQRLLSTGTVLKVKGEA